jgi:hypothetical protein
MIDATELFERTDKAFRSLRTMAEGMDVTPEWARLYAKGTAVGNAGAIFRAKLGNVDEDALHPAINDIRNLIEAMIYNADADIVAVENVMGNREANFRNAIANGHRDGYLVANRYLVEEVQYFRSI